MSMIGHNNPPNSGYILIFRQLLSHPVVGAGKPVTPLKKGLPTYSRLEAWIDLLMMAVYEAQTVTANGFKFDLRRGENVCATSYLSKRWNWSDKTVRAFLERLQNHEMITKKGAPKGQAKGKRPNHLSICNYSQYQDGAQYSQSEKGKQKGKQGGKQGGKQNTDLSDCKQKRINFGSAVAGSDKGHTEGQAKGRQYKQIKPNKPNNTLANSELEGYSALNGAANSILHGLARWIYLDSQEGRYEPDGKPIKPHFDMAEQLLKSNTDAYGAQAVKQAYAQMQGALLTKTDIRNHVKFFITVCGQEADKLRKATTRPRKVVRA